MPYLYEAMTYAKKRFAILFLIVLGIACLYLSSIHAYAESPIEFSGIIIEDGTKLYAEPSPGALVLGTYYSGVSARCIIVGNQIDEETWCAVYVPDQWYDGDDWVHGYMRMRGLFEYIADYDRKDLPYANPVGEVKTDSFVLFQKEPSDTAATIGKVYGGTIVEILGDYDTWLHVRIGFENGFLPAACVMNTGEVASRYEGPPPRGYAVLENKYGGYQKIGDTYKLPDVPADNERELFSRSVALFAKQGDWLQVSSDWSRGAAFIQDGPYNKYWMSDMIITDDIQLGQGVYQVPQDMPAGLYTFRGAEDTGGSIEVIGDSQLLYKCFDSKGQPYTLYITEGTTVSITGEGMLAPMQRINRLTAANGWKYEGNGRFLIGEELVIPSRRAVRIRLLPGETVGYYAITDLDDETGLGQRPILHKITADNAELMFYNTLEPGNFLELRNCSVDIEFGNG